MSEIRFTIVIPTALRRRMQTITDRYRVSASQLSREAITERIEYFEKKMRIEDALKTEKKALKLRKLSNGPLAPSEKEEIVTEKEVEEANDRLSRVYHIQAQRIIAAATPYERRLRIAEAASTIRREFPLTCPREDQEILTILETYVKKLRPKPEEEAPPPAAASGLLRMMDDQVGKQLDLLKAKAKTFGDIDKGEDDDDT